MNKILNRVLKGTIISFSGILLVSGMFVAAPNHAEAAITVWSQTLRGTDYSRPGLKKPYPYPAYESSITIPWDGMNCLYFFGCPETTYEPGGMADNFNIKLAIDKAGAAAHATNADSLNWYDYPNSGVTSNLPDFAWNVHGGSPSTQSINKTGGEICKMIDSTSTATWTTGSYNSPDNNKLIRYGQVAPGNVWQVANANNVGNSYISDLTCTTNALPANTLSASPTTISAGQSSTITFDAGANSEAQSTVCTPVNFSVDTHTKYSFGLRQYACTGGFYGSPLICSYDYVGLPAGYIDYNGVPNYAQQSDTSGSITVSPTFTTTYEYNCTNGNGTTLRSATVTVGTPPPPVPTVTFGGSPATIVAGGSSTLTWSSTNATSCASGNFATGGATSGTISVSPGVTTTYSMSCMGAGGTSAVSNATVTVTGTTDLVAGPVTPTTAVAGASATLSSTISNNGTAATGAGFTNLFQRATDASGTGSTDIGTHASGALAASATGAATLAHTFPSAGTWFVRVCADRNAAAGTGTITESNEANNCTTWTAVTVSPAPGPNLSAGAVTPTAATVGTPVTLSATITNGGAVTTGTTFTNNFQRATDASGTGAISIGTFANPIRTAGTSNAATLSYTFPSVATWYVRVCADNNASMVGTITETSEVDNCGAWTAVTATGPTAPNLTAGVITPTAATVGTAVTLSSTITNNGTASTQSTFTDLFQIANDASGTGATVIGTAINVGKTVGQSGPSTLSYTFTSGGTRFVRACADNNASMIGTIAESNESDNCSAWTAVTVTNPPMPDLTAANVTTSDVTAGTAVALSSVVTNNGTASTVTTFTGVFQTATSAAGAGATVIGTFTNPILAAGTSDTATIPHTFSTAGTKYVRVCADNNASFVGTIAESNEGNNCSVWRPVTVEPVPVAPPVTEQMECGVSRPFTAIKHKTWDMNDQLAMQSIMLVYLDANGNWVYNHNAYTQTDSPFTNPDITQSLGWTTDSQTLSPAYTWFNTGPLYTYGTQTVTSFPDCSAKCETISGVDFCVVNSYGLCQALKYKTGVDPSTFTYVDSPPGYTIGEFMTMYGQLGVSTCTPVSSKPNLTAGAITPTAATAGTAVTLSSTVTNNGTASTGATFTNNFQRATDASGTGAISIGTFANPIRTAGTSNAATLSYTFPSAGTWFVRACADNNASMVGTITEGNESDNCGAWTAVTVASAPAGACNFTNTNIVFNWGTGTHNFTPGSEVYRSYGELGLNGNTSRNWSASVNVTNNGVTKSFNAVCSGPNSIGAPCYVTTGAQDIGGNSVSLFFEVQSYVHARIDCSATPSTPDPNLTAGAVTPTVATIGTAVTLNSTITNNGSASTGTTFTNAFQLADDASGTGATVIGTFANPIRTAGTSNVATLSYTFTSGGTKFVRACADNNASMAGTISESNESDNCGAWTAVTVSGPNLTAGLVTPTAAVAGAPVTFSSTITNAGTVSTGVAFTDLFQVANDASGTGATDIGTFANPIRTAGTSNVATLSYTFVTPGTKFVRVCADKSSAANMGAIGETNESDNCSAWRAVTVTSPTSGPNLTSGAPTPTTATAGVAVTISATVTNNGTASTGVGFTNLFQFDADADHSAVTSTQTDTSPATAAGNSDVTSVSRTFPTGGTWYVRVCADNNASFVGSIIEMSENDNCSAWTSVNVSAATGANLVVGAVTPTSATAGTPVTVSVPVTNNGTVSTGAGFTNLFQFDNNVDHTSVTSSLTDASPAVGSGLTDTSSVSMNFPTAGTWYVRACADNNVSFVGSITESNEADNCGAWTAVSVGAAGANANLTTGTVTPVAAVAGTAVNLSAVVTNGGAVSTTYGFTNLFQIDADADPSTITSTQTDTSPVLASGATDATAVSYTFPSVGTWYVRVCADNNVSFVGVVTETNESDNCGAWTAVTVTASAGINLTAGAITPTAAVAGTPVSLVSSITNAGSASTVTTFTDVFQRATDASGTGAVVIGTFANPVRAAGSSGNATLSYTFPTAGIYYVRACADNNASFVGSIVESNELDNCGAWTGVNVGSTGAGVDLTAGAVTPSSATAGAAVAISSTVTNSGASSTGTGFTTLFQFDNDANPANGVASTQTDAVTALAPSGSQVSQVTNTFATVGTWYVRACADNNAAFVGSVTETNEGNNCSAWRTVSVTAPTGAGVTSCTVSPGSVATGTPVTWTASPAGLGTYTWAPSEGGAPGGTGATLGRTYNSAGTYGMSVGAGGGSANCPNVVVGASLYGMAVPSITAVPERVVPNGTSVLRVSATGVDSGCTLTGPGVTRDLTPTNGVIAVTNVPTAPITNQSTYVLSCDDGEATAKAIVNIIPSIQEF